MNFFNQNGNAIAYCDDSENIFEFSGRPFGYFYNSSAIYNFDGRFLGWFENGYVYDRSGNPILFTETAHNGPYTPIKRSIPMKNSTNILPSKRVVESVPLKPTTRINWGTTSSQTSSQSGRSPSRSTTGFSWKSLVLIAIFYLIYYLFLKS